jgi:hypothetical protein
MSVANATKDAGQVVDAMAKHLESVHPGKDAAFTEACVPGDAIWQGDLCIQIIESIPAEYRKVEKPQEKDRQLVPEGGEGSRHKVASLNTVELYQPEGWGEDEGSLLGPAIKCIANTTIEHPRHGNVSIPAGFSVGFTYQREYDEELRRERRARD